MAENQPKTKKDIFNERLKSKYPGEEYADEEALYGRINDDYDDYESRIGKYEEREGKLKELFSRDPRAAQFLTDMAKGEDPWTSVVKRLGIDGVTDLMNDPDKQEEYAKANKEYVDRLSKEKSLQDEYEKNFAESMTLLESIQKENGLGDETIDAAMDLVMTIANEAILGKFTEETINMALKAVNHDAAVENARAEGTIAGKNARIEEKLRKPTGGDGMPHISGSNNVPGKRNRPMSMFDIAKEA